MKLRRATIFAAAPLLFVLSGAQTRGQGSQTNAQPSPVQITRAEAATHLDHAVRPVYPQIAAVARIEGIVDFQVIVDTEGRVRELKYVSGPPILMEAGARAVRQWKYRPFMVNGQPVEAETTVEVPFGLGYMAFDFLRENNALAEKLQTFLPSDIDVIDASLGYARVADFETAVLAARDLSIPFTELRCKELGGTFCTPPTQADSMSLGKAIRALKNGMSKKEAKEAEKKAQAEAKAIA